jgi:hypothetical protein
MTVVMDNGVVRLQGQCGTEDVEMLLAALSSGTPSVDISEVDHLHGAILQVLLTFRPALLGSPRDTFVRTWLIPGLRLRDGGEPLDTPPSARSSEQ